MYVALTLTVAYAGSDLCSQTGLSDAVTQASDAFGQMDARAFEAAVGRVDRSLRCQPERLSAALCAQVHMVRGLHAFFNERRQTATACFWSAQLADPALELPPDLAPEGHVLYEIFASADAAPAPDDLAKGWPLPVDGWLLVDGQRSTVFPVDRPFVLQHMAAAGAVMGSRYVWTPEDLPPSARRTTRRTRRTLLVTGLTLDLLAAAAYGASYATRSEYDRALLAQDPSDAWQLYRWTNGLVIGSIGTAAVGLGLTTAGLATGR
ncbi:MAG: hypothetical protein KTR31_22090 [Myxococcales bacterium]|nr:hypothetical protein [Myxococcales bacterium]